jgi:hypothetical protein
MDTLGDRFNWSIDTNYKLDYSKLQYQNQYHTVEHISKKFKPGYESILGFDKIIEHLANKSKLTPLEEMNNLHSK